MNDIVTFRLDSAKKSALDMIAQHQDRDRSYILNEAVDQYLKVQEWQVAHIRKALREADKGEFASEAQVKAAFDAWRK